MPERPNDRYFRDTAKYYDEPEHWPDEPFFKEMTNRYGSPILELGCGTGRITLLLAGYGHEVMGIDLSPEMMAIAREKLANAPKVVQSRVVLHHGDITNFNLNQKFPLIVIPSSFKFLLTTDDQLACLRCVRDHLQDNGVFILDLYPGEAFEKDGTSTTDPVEIDGKRITQTFRYSNDLNTQTRTWDVIVKIEHQSGEVETIETQLITALIMPREGNLLLKLAGFEIVEEFGGWDFAPYEPDSRRRILILRKEH
jgi:SAM-dependent methyltransferase